MDRQGHLPGGQISEVMNIHSRKLYMISTAPEIGQDYWPTAVIPIVERRFLPDLSMHFVCFLHFVTDI